MDGRRARARLAGAAGVRARWRRLRPLKPGARFLGIDDAPHQRGDPSVPVVGVVTRGAAYVEAVLRTDVVGDGDDATERIAALAAGCRAASNIQAVLLQNLMVAGFNTIDMDALHEALGIPVVAVARGTLDAPAMERALTAGHIPGGMQKWARLAPGLARMAPRHEGRLSVAAAGLDPEQTDEVLAVTTMRGLMPEPVRLAHLIAAGWVLGESKGQ